MRLETERLILRETTEQDFDALYLVLADAAVMKFYPHDFDEARVKRWIKRDKERYDTFGFGLWAVCLKSTEELIGNCGLVMEQINGLIKPEIAYHIRGNMQGKGYAKEAAIAVRNWTFQNTPFQTVYSCMNVKNIPSYHTALSWGCKPVDEFEDERNGHMKVCALSREDWLRL